jgi:hypothetical protein
MYGGMWIKKQVTGVDYNHDEGEKREREEKEGGMHWEGGLW